MTAVSDIILQDAWQALRREVVSASAPLELAFARWLLGDLLPDLPTADEPSSASGFSDYREVAILGFHTASADSTVPVLGALERGLHWVTGRLPKASGMTMGFVTDAVALLGIALGAQSTGNTHEVNQWMHSFIEESLGARTLEEWERCLVIAAHSAVGISRTPLLPTAADISDVRVVLRARGLLRDDTTVEQDAIAVLDHVKHDIAMLGVRRAAIRLAALVEVTRCSPTVPIHHITAQQVTDLLRRIPAAMRRWTWESVSRTGRPGSEARKWHIENEYHVQNLLWAILAPIFPDLEDEVYTPPVGQVSPRVDLYIPSLKLLIEVKFMYPNTTPKDIIRALGEDASLYLQDQTKYQQIIAFIWDDRARTEQHELLIGGLRQISGIMDAVVVSRPGGWS